MWKKGINFLKIAIICELLVIPAIILVRHYGSTPVFAAMYRAHNSAQNLEKFVINITRITVSEGASSTISEVWKGNQDVDITQGNSLSAALNLSANIRPGNYVWMCVEMGAGIKVQGSVVLNGVTYYTKTAHTNYTTAPAELEEMPIPNPSNAIFTYFPYVMNPRTAGSGIYLLVDLDYALTYYDGNGTDPSNNGNGVQKMFVNKYNWVLTLGAPASKEVYKMQVQTQTAPNSHPFSYTYVTLLFNSNGDLIAGGGFPLLTDSLGTATDSLMIQGTFTCNSFDANSATAVNPEDFVKNSDGSYRLTFRTGRLGTPMTEIVLDKFKRSSETGGTLLFNTYQNSLSNVTNYTGTYNSEKLQ